MNNNIKKAIATGTILTSIGIGSIGTIDSCNGQAIDYNNKNVCLTKANYTVYKAEMMKEYRAGQVNLSNRDNFFDVLNIEIEKHKKATGEDVIRLFGLNQDNLLDLTINELKL